MDNNYKIIFESEEFFDFQKYYWGYQYRLADEVLVPKLLKLGVFAPGLSVVEIGCGEGGNLSAFVKCGASFALGTDIVDVRLKTASRIAELLGQKITYQLHDIIRQDLDPEWLGQFDVAIMRDVIEHLDDSEAALKNIKKLLKPKGVLFVTFPPYHSPFGGHQHIVKNFWGKFPYIHLLPDGIFHKLISTGRENDIGEVKRLQQIRLTPEKFIKAALNARYRILREEYYLLRPVFKIKFGIPPINITSMARINLIKNYFALEASYLLAQ